MKKFLLCLTGFVGIVFLCAYFAFLFYLPRAIDLNVYLPELQKIVKEQANIDLDIENPEISTNPLLQAGIKTGKITAKLPDGSTILSTDGIKVRISLPNLLLLTVKVSCVEADNLNINLEIVNGEQFKIVRLIEDILNAKKNEPQKEVPPSKFDPSWIKVKVPSTKISNYSILVNDLKTGHNLKLQGDLLDLGYNNGKSGRVKTIAQLLSDDNTNITLNLDLDSFIPPASEKDPDDDPAEKIELPFVNPVLVYRDYDLRADANLKVKLRQSEDRKYNITGYADIENVTMRLSGLQLPYSYLKAKFLGDAVDIDTNLVVKKGQKINLAGRVGFGNKPYVDLKFFSDKIYFNDLIILSKAFLDTLHIKNNLAALNASGYAIGRGFVKSDFKKMKSSGSIIARNGYVSNGRTNLVFDKINANLIFEGNKLKIVDTKTLVNGSILKADGYIDTDSYSDISVHSEKLPLPGLFLAFAPSSVRRSISLTSGALSVDAKLQGYLKNPISYANVIIDNLALQNDNMRMTNEKTVAGIVTDMSSIDGSVSNKNFRFILPKTSSTVANPTLSIKLTGNSVDILPTTLFINDKSKIDIFGNVAEYSAKPEISIKADGFLNTTDLKKFLGREAEPFIASVGNLPIKASVSGTDKKQEIILQIKSDAQNYITPVDIDFMANKSSLMQVKVFNKKDGIQIRKTGFYTDINKFGDDLDDNMSNVKTVAEVSGTIIHTNSTEPFINTLKIDIPEELQGKISAFSRSRFKTSGNLLLFGKTSSPIMRGNFKISELSIPEILTSINSVDLNLLNKDIRLDINRLLLNGSDINLNLNTDINPRSIFTIFNLNVTSNIVNLDTIFKVTEALDNYLVKSESKNNESSDIPILIRNGSINLRNLKTGNILVENLRSRLSLRNNDLFLNNIRCDVFNGKVNGDVVTNLKDLIVGVKLSGNDLDVEKALLDSANVKDALTGTMNFSTDLTLNVKEADDIIKNINGNILFDIFNGQLGPFGKLENMILAENIRESQFFQTAIGGVINNLATVDTTHFKLMNGIVFLENGIAKISPITTIGSVMSLHIAGEFNILQNTADMKVRAKLGSVIANMLGPISQLNPINLVQVTPGLNVVMAKTFFLFCEELTPEETAALPKLETDLDDKMATKFQVVLKGDVSKPLTLVKSFKWLALASEIQAAEGFVESLPDPSIVEDSQNATIEEIMKAQEEKAKEDAKLINRIKRFLKR